MEELTAPDNAAAVIRDLAFSAAEPDPLVDLDVDVDPLVFRTADGRVEVVDPERFARNPHRRRGIVSATTPAGFAKLVNRHGNPRSTVVYANLDNHSLVAVFNDHTAVAPGMSGWGDHRAVLQLKPSEEWVRWERADATHGGMMGQEEFARLIEDFVDDIESPAGPKMLEMAQTFRANVDTDIRQTRRLHNGETDLVWKENVQASAGSDGALTIPSQFELKLRPWVGSPPYIVTARFRYRVAQQKLTVGFERIRVDRVLEGAFNDTLAALIERFDVDVEVVEAAAPDPVAPRKGV